jgi:uncharacterized protein YcfL
MKRLIIILIASMALISCEVTRQVTVYKDESHAEATSKVIIAVAILIASIGVLVNGFVTINHNYKDKKEK